MLSCYLPPNPHSTQLLLVSLLQWRCQKITPKNCFYIKSENLQKCMDVCFRVSWSQKDP